MTPTQPDFAYDLQIPPGGETGKRRGLKIPGPNGRAGSNPAPGTRTVRPAKAAQVSAIFAHRRQVWTPSRKKPQIETPGDEVVPAT